MPRYVLHSEVSLPDPMGNVPAPPEVSNVDGDAGREADVAPASGDGGGSVAQVEQDHGDVAVREQFAPDLRGRAVAHNDTLGGKSIDYVVGSKNSRGAG